MTANNQNQAFSDQTCRSTVLEGYELTIFLDVDYYHIYLQVWKWVVIV
jgi:hypothetical protein